MPYNSINNSAGNAYPRFLGPKAKTVSAEKAIAQLPFICFSPTADKKAQAVTDTFHQTGNGKPAIDFFNQQEKALATPKKRKREAKVTPNKSARTARSIKSTRKTD